MWRESARGRESLLGAAIRTAHDLQAKSATPLVLYIFEDDNFNLHVHDHEPSAGVTYLLVQANGRVVWIYGLDSKIGNNVADVLRYCRENFLE